MQQVEGRRLELLQRDYELEVVGYEAVLRDDPKNYIAWVQQGRCLKKLNRLKEAVRSCEQAISINPEYARAYYNKACYHALQDDIESTLQALNQAIIREVRYKAMARRDPDFDLIRNNDRFQAFLSQT
jgi:tetratricopeptide (TPR) repeat protein